MRGTLFTRVHLLLALLSVIVAPGIVNAQSAITGKVTDTSGGVLPGVTIVATSPALIEQQRTVVTDSQGVYLIDALRPGTYRVTFSLDGFTTFVRDGFDLVSGFTGTINAAMNVGAVAEQLTVTGQSPMVDVRSTQPTTSVSRSLLDNIPSTRVWEAAAVIIPAVKASLQNVGGSRTATQPRMTVHGTGPQDTTVDFDGFKANTSQSGGSGQHNWNEAEMQEVTVQTGPPSAEVSSGGLHMNFIPKEGGNRVSGATYAGYTNGAWQSNNLSPDLVAKGISQPTATDFVRDISVSAGGPIQPDRLWLIGAYRNIGNNDIVANSFYPDGRPGMQENRLQSVSARLTWQITSKNRLAAYDDRAFKSIDHEYTSGTDVLTAAKRRYPRQVLYAAGTKWTSTLSNKFLLESAWTVVVQNYHTLFQPGVAKERGTPEWYATASRFDITLATRTAAGTPYTRNYLPAYQFASKASYVTGSHAFKSGVAWRYGTVRAETDTNADLVQQYRNGVPDSVVVYNTPVSFADRLNADLGIFAQDSWTLRRLTLNPGIRFEYLNESIQAVNVPPGRFAPYRQFPRVSDIPNWFNVAPRFTAVYDLTGDARTALRVGLNRYYLGDFVAIANRYDPMRLQSDTRNWSDCDYVAGTSTCSGLALPTNHDDIAEDNEIGPSNTTFGTSNRRADPGLERQYFTNYNIQVDHQILSRLSVTFAWNRDVYHNLEALANVLVTPSDFSAFETINPLTGDPITIYNLNKSKQGQVDNVDMTSTDGHRKQTYSDFEISFNARLAGGGTLFGGWSAERTVSVDCASTDPNTFLYCDQTQLKIPYRSDFRFAGSYPLPLGLQVGTQILSYAGHPLAVNWSVPASLFPGGRTQAVTVPLIPPGSKYARQWNQVDVTLKKLVKFNRTNADVALEVYNLLNSSVVLNENQTFGTSLGKPTDILQGRLLRVSCQIRF